MTRIYAACLASYNNGCLHGAWIDADQDVESIRAEIDAMLRASPYPNVTRCYYTCAKCEHIWTRDVSPYTAVPVCCPECFGTMLVHGTPYATAEEYAIHDSDGFHGLIGEYSPVDEVVQVAAALAEHGSKYAGLRKDGYDHDEALAKLEEDYCGEYDNLTEWAERFTDDSGLFHGISHDNPLRLYFDYAAYARDAQLGGDIMTIDDEDNGTIHVFYTR
jgi:antirestriction protein